MLTRIYLHLCKGCCIANVKQQPHFKKIIESSGYTLTYDPEPDVKVSYLFQALFKTTDNEMQLNPESKKKQLSADFIQASWYFHLYLGVTEGKTSALCFGLFKRPHPIIKRRRFFKNRWETLGLLKQKFLLAPLSYFSKMSIDHEMANHIASDTSAHYDRTKTLTVLSHPAESHTHLPTSYPHVLIHPEPLWMSYLWIVKVRERCYAFDVFNSELVLGVG